MYKKIKLVLTIAGIFLIAGCGYNNRNIKKDDCVFVAPVIKKEPGKFNITNDTGQIPNLQAQMNEIILPAVYEIVETGFDNDIKYNGVRWPGYTIRRIKPERFIWEDKECFEQSNFNATRQTSDLYQYKKSKVVYSGENKKQKEEIHGYIVSIDLLAGVNLKKLSKSGIIKEYNADKKHVVFAPYHGDAIKFEQIMYECGQRDKKKSAIIFSMITGGE